METTPPKPPDCSAGFTRIELHVVVPLLRVAGALRGRAALRTGSLTLALFVAGCSGEGASSAAKDGKEIITESEFKEMTKTAKNQRDFNKALQRKLMEDTGTIKTGARAKARSRP